MSASIPTSLALSGIVTVAQAAVRLDVSTDTIRRMIDRGDLYAERIGPRLIRVDLNSLRTSPIGGAE